MASFLYLLRDTAGNWQQPSPEEMERLTKAWISWMDRLRKGGHLVRTGERLEDTGTVVRGKAKTVTKDVVVGYLLVQAGDLDEAVELAKGCPNLVSGGAVEVRPVVST